VARSTSRSTSSGGDSLTDDDSSIEARLATGIARPVWQAVLTLVPAIVLGTLALAGCGSGGGEQSESDRSLVDRGARVYAASCASCHGADLRGTDKGPSHLSNVYEPDHHPDESFRNAIANGAPQHHWRFGDMPAVEGLSDEDVEAVIAYVRAEQQRQGFEQSGAHG